MNTVYDKLFEPFYLHASGIKLKNRIIMAPMTTWSGNEDGSVSDEEISYYKRRSGGMALVITACAYVIPQGKGFSGQIGAHDDAMIPSLKKIASTIHENGSLAVLQLYHGGRMSPPDVLPDKRPLSASSVAAEREGAPVPKSMSEAEILETIIAFGMATRRAIIAGFDGVEIHGANTYLIQQFFSPHSNHRNDQWGGDLQKRMTFPLAVTRTVLNTVSLYANKPFIVGYRLSPEEIENPGITIKDTLTLVEALAKEKLDYLHISTMDFNAGSLRDKNDIKPRTVIIQEKIGHKIPIIGVGQIHTPEDACRILDTGIPLVAMGRELLMEPDWVRIVESGQSETIRTTLSLNAQKELAIPDNLWHEMITRKGWLPIEADAEQ